MRISNDKNTPNHPSAAVTITRDSSAAGFQAQLSFPPGADSSELELADISMTGVGFRANKSETSAEFVLHGVYATDSAVFYAMRGKASLDKTIRAIKSVSGTFIGALNDGSGTEHCFDFGTFQTGKELS